MPNTKDFIPVSQVRENAVILHDGSVVMVIQTSAVNFDLLSEPEQLAIIGSFAGLLNSLSFSIQILIRSKKLDISHYLGTLREAEKKQHNPLLQLMMQHYRAFVAAIIRDNEVLDKQFFVILAVSPIELGAITSSDAEKNLDKALTILNPRRDHILKQLSRIGLKSDQLDNEKLIKLFYDIYNGEDKVSLSDVQGNPANQTPANAPTKFEHGANQKPLTNPIQKPQPPITPRPITPPSSPPIPVQAATPAPAPAPIPQPQVASQPLPPAQTSRPVQPPPPPIQPQPTFAPQTTSPTIPSSLNAVPSSQPLYSSTQPGSRNPFVVEELPS